MRYLALILLLLLAACGGEEEYTFAVGSTKFVMMEGADAWPDLPEAVDAMQRGVEGPSALWDTTVYIYPVWYNITYPGIVCYFDSLHDGVIHIRADPELEPTTWDSCLGHEFGHRWDNLVLGGGTALRDHGPEWAAFTEELQAAAKLTWAHHGSE